MKFACGSQSPSNTRRGKIDWRTFVFIESNYWGRAIVTNLSEDFQYQTELELFRKKLWEKEEKLNQYPLSHHRSQETISSWRNTLQQAWAEESLVNHL